MADSFSQICHITPRRRDTHMTYQARLTEPDRTPPAQCPAQNPVYDAQRLVGADGTATIVLDDKSYTLRITRAGKLILTK